MDVASRSRDRVEERLQRLESEFGTLEVTQMTFEVDSDNYRRAVDRSREDRLSVRAVVRDDEGAVLVHEGENEWLCPQGETKPDEQVPDAVRRIVRDVADIDYSLLDTATANIHGIRNSDDETAATVYRLSVVFTAEATGPVPAADDSVRWDTEADAAGELV
jgi:hypothetical protein